MWGRGGDGRATLAGRAGAPALGSHSPETQSQLRKGPGPGAGLQARGAPSRCAPPPALPLRPALRRTRQERAGRTGRGWGGGTRGRSSLQRPARADLTRDPRAGQAGTAWDRQRQASTPGAPSPLARAPPLPLNFETCRPPVDPQFGPCKPGPLEPSLP